MLKNDLKHFRPCKIISFLFLLGKVGLHSATVAPGYEIRMLQEETFESVSGRQAFVEFDQFGGNQRSVRDSKLSPVALQVAFGRALPIEGAE